MSNPHETYYANYGDLGVAEYVQRHIRESAGEMQRMRRTVELVPAGVASLLDVGAGHGVFLEELRSARGIAGTGIEVTPAKVDYGRARGLDMRLGNAAALDFPSASFDAVLSSEVLEHLPFGVYEAALAELARVAREWVIVTVPHSERRRFVRCPYCAARVNPDYHMRSFTPAAMAALLPGLRLVQTLGLGALRRSVLVDIGRQWFERWPAFLVCPCCGFKPASAARSGAPGASAAGAPAGVGGLAQTARRVARWLPARERPLWLVGVYRKEPPGA